MPEVGGGGAHLVFFQRGEQQHMQGVEAVPSCCFTGACVKEALTPPISAHCHHLHLGPGCLLSCQLGSGRDPDSAKGILGVGAASLHITLSPTQD